MYTSSTLITRRGAKGRNGRESAKERERDHFPFLCMSNSSHYLYERTFSLSLYKFRGTSRKYSPKQISATLFVVGCVQCALLLSHSLNLALENENRTQFAFIVIYTLLYVQRSKRRGIYVNMFAIRLLVVYILVPCSRDHRHTKSLDKNSDSNVTPLKAFRQQLSSRILLSRSQFIPPWPELHWMDGGADKDYRTSTTSETLQTNALPCWRSKCKKLLLLPRPPHV